MQQIPTALNFGNYAEYVHYSHWLMFLPVWENILDFYGVLSLHSPTNHSRKCLWWMFLQLLTDCDLHRTIISTCSPLHSAIIVPMPPDLSNTIELTWKFWGKEKAFSSGLYWVHRAYNISVKLLCKISVIFDHKIHIINSLAMFLPVCCVYWHNVSSDRVTFFRSTLCYLLHIKM